MNGFSEEISLEGHIIDSWILPKVFDTVMDLAGNSIYRRFGLGGAKTKHRSRG